MLTKVFMLYANRICVQKSFSDNEKTYQTHFFAGTKSFACRKSTLQVQVF